eukprot:UC1_evm1s1582
MHRIPLPALVPGPGNPQYDSGNLHGPAPKLKPEPGPSPSPSPPPPTPPTPPYGPLAFPKTPSQAQKVASVLLHEALAPYLIVAQAHTFFSYAYFYGSSEEHTSELQSYSDLVC